MNNIFVADENWCVLVQKMSVLIYCVSVNWIAVFTVIAHFIDSI